MSTTVAEAPVRNMPTLLAFGAHPDDLEFGAGGLLLAAAAGGMSVHLVIASKGEAGTNGSAAEREAEALAAADLLGAQVSWVDFGGDAHMATATAHSITVAEIVRQVRPTLVLAPTVVADQHPDHAVVGMVVRDGLRLARYGNVAELRGSVPCSVSRFYQYAIAPSAEPAGSARVLVDVSAYEADWVRLMRCHASQLKTRRYIDLQLARARVWGLQAGVGLAQMLFSGESLFFEQMRDLPATARQF